MRLPAHPCVPIGLLCLEKYRTIKKTNPTFHRKLGGLTGGVDVLKSIGFTEQGDDLVRVCNG